MKYDELENFTWGDLKNLDYEDLEKTLDQIYEKYLDSDIPLKRSTAEALAKATGEKSFLNLKTVGNLICVLIPLIRVLYHLKLRTVSLDDVEGLLTTLIVALNSCCPEK